MKLKTIDIKGKPYVTINERIKYFRSAEEYKGWGIVTEIVEMSDKRVVFKATVFDENKVLRATGHAYEDQDKGYINKESFVENCETGAVGRALGNLGIGVDTSIASADEVQRAIKKQEMPPPPPYQAHHVVPGTADDPKFCRQCKKQLTKSEIYWCNKYDLQPLCMKHQEEQKKNDGKL